MNNFKELEARREAMLPDELEFDVVSHVGNLSHFGNVAEHFVSNPFDTIIKIFSNEGGPGAYGGGRRLPADGQGQVDWRIPQFKPIIHR